MSLTPRLRPLISYSVKRSIRAWSSTSCTLQQQQTPAQVIDPQLVSQQPATTPTAPTLDPIAPPPPIPESITEPTPISRVQRPVGAFRGGFIGFLLGMTAVGGFGYMQLLDDYSRASNLLLASVEELRKTTGQVKAHKHQLEAPRLTLTMSMIADSVLPRSCHYMMIILRRRRLSTDGVTP